MNKIVDIHCHNKTDDPRIIEVFVANVKSLCFPPPLTEGPICVGLHPWLINDIPLTKFLPLLKQYLASANFYALGEIGLDKVCNVDYDEQREIFIEQLTLAKKLKLKRVIIHSVKSHSDIISIFKKLQVKNKFLIHDFYASIETAKQYLNYDCYFSFGKKLFTNPKAQEVMTKLPLERIMLETDDQLDYNIFEIYAQAALLLNMKLNKLQAHLHNNYQIFSS